MPNRKKLWWRLYQIIMDNTPLSQDSAADLADTIWLLFRRTI